MNIDDLPERLKEIFIYWCNTINYPICFKSFEMFADDCFVNYITNYTNYDLQEELDDDNSGFVIIDDSFKINGYALYTAYFDRGICEEMKQTLDKINEDIRNRST